MFDNRAVAQTAKFLDEALVVATVYCLPVGECRAWTSLEAALALGGLHAQVFIYDNSPEDQVPPRSNHVTLHYQHDATNPGISHAYNAARRVATREGKKWLLFLDQDTRIDAHALAKYATSINTNPTHSLFAPVVLDSKGVLSPFRFRKGRGIRVVQFPYQFLPLNEFRAINAGLLVSIELFSKAGGYDEAIPLDFSDIAFLEKAKGFCDTLCRVDATLEQEFSGTTLRDVPVLLERFKKYNEGALQFAHHYGSRFAIRRGTFLRAIKLSLQWKRVEFLRIHFKTWKA